MLRRTAQKAAGEDGTESGGGGDILRAGKAAERLDGGDGAQFAAALRWILGNQLPDGSWGDAVGASSARCRSGRWLAAPPAARRSRGDAMQGTQGLRRVDGSEGLGGTWG